MVDLTIKNTHRMPFEVRNAADGRFRGNSNHRDSFTHPRDSSRIREIADIRSHHGEIDLALRKGRRRIADIAPFASSDPDSKRIWWTDGGVHQNLTFPVHPDPISGMHCWHQAVRVEPARPGDQYGDVQVDTNKSMQIYREWLALTRPASGPLRRPLWLGRAVRPTDDAYRL